MKEIIDIFDENMNHIGVMEKGEAHEKRQWHKNSHIWVTDGESVLLQLRGKNMSNPNKWEATVSGHFSAGETPNEAAKKEWEEELGLKWDLGDRKEDTILKFYYLADGKPVYEFVYLYFIKKNIDLSKLKIQEEELTDIKYFPYREFVELFRSSDFVPYPDYYQEVVLKGIEPLLSKRKTYGTL